MASRQEPRQHGGSHEAVQEISEAYEVLSDGEFFFIYILILMDFSIIK